MTRLELQVSLFIWQCQAARAYKNRRRICYNVYNFMHPLQIWRIESIFKFTNQNNRSKILCLTRLLILWRFNCAKTFKPTYTLTSNHINFFNGIEIRQLINTNSLNFYHKEKLQDENLVYLALLGIYTITFIVNIFTFTQYSFEHNRMFEEKILISRIVCTD